MPLSLSNDYLEHHGIKGQKWGVRRYQNPDGTLTAEGLAKYREVMSRHSGDKLFELRTAYSRSKTGNSKEIAAIKTDKLVRRAHAINRVAMVSAAAIVAGLTVKDTSHKHESLKGAALASIFLGLSSEVSEKYTHHVANDPVYAQSVNRSIKTYNKEAEKKQERSRNIKRAVVGGTVAVAASYLAYKKFNQMHNDKNNYNVNVGELLGTEYRVGNKNNINNEIFNGYDYAKLLQYHKEDWPNYKKN